MNFLAHLVLAGDDEGLRMGALLGDFTRGRFILRRFTPQVRLGIQLHRHIDATVDSLPAVEEFRTHFPDEFRRYAGIVSDLLYDHVLARRWGEYREESIEQFDQDVRRMLERNAALVPAKLQRFMRYADTYGLFAAYREKGEVLRALTGLGGRFKRRNPLHRVDEIWDRVLPVAEQSFAGVFGELQSDVSAWLNLKSTTSGL